MSGLSRFRNSLQQLDASSDKDLGEYFQQTATARTLADPLSKRVLGIGLKGIGKSATYRFLVEFDRSATVAIGIRPPASSISLDTSGLNYSVCQKQLTNDLVIEALRGIGDSESEGISASLKRQAGSYFSKYKRLIEAANGRFGGISILGCGFTVNKPESRTLVGLQNDAENRPALELLEKICASGVRVRVVVDDPELIFSETRELDTHFLGGLFLAALELSKRIPNLKVILLLKSHVFFPIRNGFEELDKHPWSHLRFSWSREELLELIEKRIAWAGTRWQDILGGSSEDAARELILQTVCSKIRTGPRELIYWLETAIAMRERAKEPLSFDRTKRVLAKYSLGSLARSHHDQYPGISEVIGQVFREHREQAFSHGELANHVSGLKAGNDDFRTLWRHSWLQSETPNTVANVLFNVGALAFSVDERLILPFEADYHEDLFEAADTLRLVPALVEAI